MKIKGLQDEDFINYKLPSMYIATATCSFKCDKEHGSTICQNSELAMQPTHDIDYTYLIERYRYNQITQAIVFGGLEPMDSFDELLDFIHYCRESWFEDLFNHSGCYITSHIMDDIVIYTGYNKDEIEDKIEELKKYPNIVVKFGRYIPNQQHHFDKVLGVYLASDNQYAERIS